MHQETIVSREIERQCFPTMIFPASLNFAAKRIFEFQTNQDKLVGGSERNGMLGRSK